MERNYPGNVDLVPALLAAFLHLALQSPTVVPVPRGADWLKRHEAMVAVANRGEAQIVFIGDSITHAFGGEPNTGESFADRGADTWKIFYGADRALNLGISGDRTQHVLWRLDHGGLGSCKPKVAVIMIGTNNANSDSPEQIAEGIRAVCGRVRTLSPATKILLLGVFPRDKADSKLRVAVNQVNTLMQSWARNNSVSYLDIGYAFLDSAGQIPPEIMPDGLHPMGLGYRQWAIAMEPTLAKLMDRASKSNADPRNTAVVPVTHNRDRAKYDWMTRFQATKDYAKQHPCRLAFIGDSILHFFGGPPLDRGLTQPTPEWSAYYENRDAVDLGFGWDRTENVLWRLEQGQLENMDLEAVVLMIGTNNLHLNAPEQIRDGIKAIVRMIQKQKPRASILLHAIFPRGASASDPARQKVAQINALLEPMAKQLRVDFMDAGHVFLEKDGTISKEVMPDGLHPTPRAYLRWAGEIEPWIARHVQSKAAIGSRPNK